MTQKATNMEHKPKPHKNGDKHDNRIENLEIMSDISHRREHAIGRGFDPKTGRFKKN